MPTLDSRECSGPPGIPSPLLVAVLGTARSRSLPAGRVLTTVARQQIWAAKDLRACPVMVWMPYHTGHIEQTRERLAVLFIVAAYCGLRRDELLGLTWDHVDYGQRVI
jgi:integrase